VSNLFMFFSPLLNWRHVKVTNHRKAWVVSPLRVEG
jgi:hypothetical protein